ncbi:hypothetical protein JKF63_03956 [Porcisia hertigi]|uniref:Uncharacterized protein n=1 Tax=Porcisia hertigi TaxID=2761500 RepID=A0A836L7H6_9TRYP|nr:hypothetical protein JKF63_03956 [Porcisia hertigi]
MLSHSAEDASSSRPSLTYVVLFRPQGVCKLASDLPGALDGPSNESIEVRVCLTQEEDRVLLHLRYPVRDASSLECRSFTTATAVGGGRAKRNRLVSRWSFLHLSHGGNSPSVVVNECSRSHKAVRKIFVKKKYKHGGAGLTAKADVVRPIQTQQYTIALKGISPVAAQLPLSADLRSRLHLNVADREAATYSSHSTPYVKIPNVTGDERRRAPPALPSNLSMPPSRGLAAVSSRTRDPSLSPHGVRSGFGKATPAAYTQYLDVEEPFRSHGRPSPLPSLTDLNKSVNSRQSNYCLGGEGSTTMPHHTPGDHRSNVQSKPGKWLRTPLLETAGAQPTPSVTQLGNPSLSVSTSPPTATTGLSISTTNALLEYEDLLTVAFVGVPESADSQQSSFTDNAGCMLADRKRRLSSYHRLSHRLLGWIERLRKDQQRRPTSSTVSTSSGSSSDTAGSSTKNLHQPHRKRRSPRGGIRSSQSQALPSPADEDPQRGLERSFPLNRLQTFYLRFLDETDMRDFLSGYVALQAFIKELQEKRSASAEGVEEGGSGGTETGPSDPIRSLVDDGQTSLRGAGGNDLLDGDTNCLHTPPTATYLAVPSDAEPGGSRRSHRSTEKIFNDFLGNGALEVAADSGRERCEGDKRDSAARPPASVVPSVLCCSGWQHYVQYKMDPRYGLPFASVPLFLWHAFLPFASSVLYSCDRGFLIVERLSPLSSSPQSEDESHDASSPEPHFFTGGPAKRVGKAVCPPRRSTHGTYTKKRETTMSSGRRQTFPNCQGVEKRLLTPPHPEATPESLELTPSSALSWESEKQGPPVADAAYERNVDHVTTFSDVFLCLSESHLLFVNSFGRLCFHCRVDEVTLITHSAATKSFLTYPFIFFRLRPSEFFGAPTFAFTFTHLPEAPHRPQVTTPTAASRFQPENERATQRGFVPLAWASQASTSDTAHCSRLQSPRAPAAVSGDAVTLLSSREKRRLLRRHKALLDIFEAVSSRPLEKHTFAQLTSCKFDKAQRARLRRLISGVTKKVSMSPLVTKPTGAYGSAPLQTLPQQRTHPIPCVQMDAEDLYSITDAEKPHPERVHFTSLLLPCASLWRPSRGRKGQPLRLRALPAYANPSLCQDDAFTGSIPRWSDDDPGLVLQDFNDDMELSLERATRMVPMLVSKEAVCQGYMSSSQESLPHDSRQRRTGSHSAKSKAERGERRGATTTDSGRTEETYAPIVAKKRVSSFVRRTAMNDL